MKQLPTMLLCIVSISFISYACTSPWSSFSSGVVFNNLEQFQPSRLESMGTQTENYLKSCEKPFSDSSIKNVVMVTPTMKIGIAMDPVQIKEVVYADNRLMLTVAYSGGCATHEFSLYAFTSLAESMPPIAQLQLSHNGNGDQCEALITETITFNLQPSEAYYSSFAPIIMSIAAPAGEDTFNKTNFQWYPNNSCTYTYRSHYFSEAMVYLSYNTGGPSSPRMVIVVDPEVRFIVPFDFSKAITTELIWLTTNGILSGISNDKILKIGDESRKSIGLYWTRQDSLLAHNAVYTYTMNSEGSYTWGDPQAYRSNCGSNAEFTLPPKVIVGSVPVTSSNLQSHLQHQSFSVHISGSNILLNLPQLPSRQARVAIINSQGQKILSFRPSSESKTVSKVLSRPLAQGVYQVVFMDKSVQQAKKVIIMQ